MAAMIPEYLKAHSCHSSSSAGGSDGCTSSAAYTSLASRQGPRSRQGAQAGTRSPRDGQQSSLDPVRGPPDGYSSPPPVAAGSSHVCKQLNAAASQAAALQAGVVWQHYGEQSTFWFNHLARERRGQAVIPQLSAAGQPGHITLDSYACTQQAMTGSGGLLSVPALQQGLFAPPETSPHAQHALLMALDLHLTPQQRQQGEGAAGDGSLSLEVLTQILQALAVRQVARALMACHMSSH